MTDTTLLWTIVAICGTILFFVVSPWIFKFFREMFKNTRYSAMGESSKIRLVRQLNDAVEELSAAKTGAIITIVNREPVEHFRTDGVKINANISSALIISIFNKHSPLHDGAIVIDNNIITYAATYYKITSKSLSNKYGARHRAAMGISEQTDALTIIVSEETGNVSFTKNSSIIPVKMAEFQERLTEYLQ